MFEQHTSLVFSCIVCIEHTLWNIPRNGCHYEASLNKQKGIRRCNPLVGQSTVALTMWNTSRFSSSCIATLSNLRRNTVHCFQGCHRWNQFVRRVFDSQISMKWRDKCFREFVIELHRIVAESRILNSSFAQRILTSHQTRRLARRRGERPSIAPFPKNNGDEARRAEFPLFFGNGAIRGFSLT